MEVGDLGEYAAPNYEESTRAGKRGARVAKQQEYMFQTSSKELRSAGVCMYCRELWVALEWPKMQAALLWMHAYFIVASSWCE